MERIAITKDSLSSQVYEILRNMILDGKWEVGEKLPSEGELAELFKVSRLTIRIALDKLNMIGLLETFVGKGTYVKHFDCEQYFDDLSEIMLSNDEVLKDVYEFRQAIELKSGELLINWPEALDFSKLESMCEEMSRVSFTPNDVSLREQLKVYATMDYKFHLEICRMSGNDLLYLSYAMAKRPIIRYLFSIALKRYEEQKVECANKEKVNLEYIFVGENYKNHYAIVDALKSKDFVSYQKICNSVNNYYHSTKNIKSGID